MWPVGAQQLVLLVSDEVPVKFFLLLLAAAIVGIVLIVRGLREKPRRPLTKEERLYLDLMYLQDYQNMIDEERRRDDRLRD